MRDDTVGVEGCRCWQQWNPVTLQEGTMMLEQRWPVDDNGSTATLPWKEAVSVEKSQSLGDACSNQTHTGRHRKGIWRTQHTLQLFMHCPQSCMISSPRMYLGFLSHSPAAAQVAQLWFKSLHTPGGLHRIDGPASNLDWCIHLVAVHFSPRRTGHPA